MLEDVFIDRNWSVLLRGVLLVDKFKHTLSKQIVLQVIISVKVHRLLCAIFIFIPCIVTRSFLYRLLLRDLYWCLRWRVHSEVLHDFVSRYVSIRNKLNKRQGIKTTEVPYHR